CSEIAASGEPLRFERWRLEPWRLKPWLLEPSRPNDARRDSSHFENQPRSVCDSSALRVGSQSNVAHHSTKVRSPSTIGVRRIVAWKPVTGSEGGPQNS